MFVDTNANNTPDPGEGAASIGITATWFGPNAVLGGGDDLVYTTATNGSGVYSFTGLPAGGFRVAVDPTNLPAGAVAIVDPDGGNDNVSTLTLAAGATNNNQDFGYVVPAIDLSVTKSDGGATTAPGQTVVYTINYGNSATATTPSTGVVLTETIPGNSTFNAGASTGGWVCGATTCTFAVGTLAPGATGSVTFAVTVVNPIPAGVGQINNAVTITDDGAHGTDANSANNTGTDFTPVNAAPDLTVSKSDGGATSVPGGTVAYTISYGNVGNQGATGVVLTETIPANSTFNAVRRLPVGPVVRPRAPLRWALSMRVPLDR